MKTKSKALEAIREFNRVMDWEQFHTAENLAKSISIEAAELLECFQWDSNYDPEATKEELADVYSYVLMMADELDVDLEEIALKKLEKNKAKYPVEEFKGSSAKYNQLKSK
ncbi:MAG: nucleotide pyrophosphohydrolase [Clostridiales bacterium]|nr:nucleotide pyrophosphohydrolase [Clostridiales bacterium]